MDAPETRKPTSQKIGSLKLSNCLAAFDISEDSETLVHLQAARILRRFPMSGALAVTTARLAFGGRCA